MVYLLVALAVAAVGVSAICLVKYPAARRKLPRATLVLAAIIALPAGCVLILNPMLKPAPREAIGKDPQPRKTPGEYVRTLAPGAEAPPLEAAGWLNGPPPRPGEKGPRLILLDIWAHW